MAFWRAVMDKYKVVFNTDRVEEAKQIRTALRQGRSTRRVPFEFAPEIPEIKYSMGERVRDIDKELECQVAYMNYRFREFPGYRLYPVIYNVSPGAGTDPIHVRRKASD